MNVDFEVVSAAQNVFSEKIFGPGLGQRSIQNAGAFGKLAADINIGEVHIIRETGDDHPFQQLMRVFVDDLAIFERSWLGFIRIANEVNRLAALSIDKRPFQAARETCPAAST